MYHTWLNMKKLKIRKINEQKNGFWYGQNTDNQRENSRTDSI